MLTFLLCFMQNERRSHHKHVMLRFFINLFDETVGPYCTKIVARARIERVD